MEFVRIRFPLTAHFFGLAKVRDQACNYGLEIIGFN